ncbi:hypothetical protein RCL_jg21957.t1 [Rhizophagus clarus]|uniref:Uncharacterized protein n=1 Tax=Rhizophagus clarus TaxID=94130 RepID=A0A8H3ME73_9GLOM|nr:hypothetical protein RCL_jg21957.t1 [Rhizophagus clarus]
MVYLLIERRVATFQQSTRRNVTKSFLLAALSPRREILLRRNRKINFLLFGRNFVTRLHFPPIGAISPGIIFRSRIC